MHDPDAKVSPVDRTRPYALLAIAAAILTIALKTLAYLLTGSVGLLSDAAESTVNLITALATLWALTLSARIPDEAYPHGYTKAEYFSSGLEGAMILVAAGGIAVTASGRLFAPQPIEHIGLGLGLSLAATLINGGVGFLLVRAGRSLRSLPLRADGQHLLVDVWTSVGVVVGLVLVQVTGWLVLDPIVALLVAANIVLTGLKLVSETASGLLDRAMEVADIGIIEDALAKYKDSGVQFHALRTRQAASRRFISLHVLVPGEWSVQKGHDLCEAIERRIEDALPGSHMLTHLEPLEDPSSWDDVELLKKRTG